jgi:hypothetical protein
MKAVDWMSIFIEMDANKPSYIDYLFICDVWIKDPRYKNRNMHIGQNRGLFRIKKETLEVELLFAMEGDGNNDRFHRAAAKVLREYKNTHNFPEQTHYACG